MTSGASPLTLVDDSLTTTVYQPLAYSVSLGLPAGLLFYVGIQVSYETGSQTPDRARQLQPHMSLQAMSKTTITSYASVQENLTESRSCYTPALYSPSRLLFVWSL